MNTLVAELRYDIAYADLENSYAGVYAAVGRDPLPGRVTAKQSVSELTEALKAHWEAL